MSQCLGGVAALTAVSADPSCAGFGPGATCSTRVQQQQLHRQHRGMRRFAKRRRTLAAFTAIMGRLSRAASGSTSSSQHQANAGGTSGAKAAFKVHYRKLSEESSPTKQPRRDDGGRGQQRQQQQQQSQHQVKFVPPLPDYMSYCCCRCGHTQKLKVSAGLIRENGGRGT